MPPRSRRRNPTALQRLRAEQARQVRRQVERDREIRRLARERYRQIRGQQKRIAQAAVRRQREFLARRKIVERRNLARLRARQIRARKRLAEQIRLLRQLEKRGRYKPKRPVRYQTPRRIREKARESEKKAEILPVPERGITTKQRFGGRDIDGLMTYLSNIVADDEARPGRIYRIHLLAQSPEGSWARSSGMAPETVGDEGMILEVLDGLNTELADYDDLDNETDSIDSITVLVIWSREHLRNTR